MLPMPPPYVEWYLVQHELHELEERVLHELDQHHPPPPQLCQRMAQLQHASCGLLPRAMRSITI